MVSCFVVARVCTQSPARSILLAVYAIARMGGRLVAVRAARAGYAIVRGAVIVEVCRPRLVGERTYPRRCAKPDAYLIRLPLWVIADAGWCPVVPVIHRSGPWCGRPYAASKIFFQPRRKRAAHVRRIIAVVYCVPLERHRNVARLGLCAAVISRFARTAYHREYQCCQKDRKSVV